MKNHWASLDEKFNRLDRERKVQLKCLFPEHFEENGLDELGDKAFAMMAVTDLEDSGKIRLVMSLTTFMDRNPVYL